MAGLLINLGIGARNNHEKCLREYVKAKGMPISFQQRAGQFCLTKFSRKGEIDNNIRENEDVLLWAVGTPIFRERSGKSTLIELSRELSAGRIEDVVKDLDGSFALVIKKRNEKGVRVITDHAGILNLYLYQGAEALAISSSALAISRAFKVTLNTEGVLQFLRNATVSDSKTVYNEINLLEPASIYWIEYEPVAKIKSRDTYWKSPIEVREDMRFGEAREALGKVLSDAVSAVRASDTVCDLTAGYDSRLIVSAQMAGGKLDSAIHTFVFGPEQSEEVRLVKEYCKTIRLTNHHLALGEDWIENFSEYVSRSFLLSDGEENACVYAPILLAQEFKAKNFAFSLNGLGGELYRDFWWIQEIFSMKRPADLGRLINTRVLQYEYEYSIFSEEWRRKFVGIKEILKGKYKNAISDMDGHNTYNTLQIDNVYLRQKVRKWAGRTISTSNQLVATVAPLTFKKCLEIGMSVPPRYKRNGHLVRATVQKLAPQLAQLRMLNGMPCTNCSFLNFYRFLPYLCELSKKGLRKVSQGLVGKTIFLNPSLTYDNFAFFQPLLRTRFREQLDYENMATRGIYDKKNFEKFLKDAQEPGFRYYYQLGNILTLELRVRGDRLGKGI